MRLTDEVSTTCDSRWVISELQPFLDPPATAGGTDPHALGGTDRVRLHDPIH